VNQVVNGGSKLLQGFVNELGPSYQLSLEHCFQVVVIVAILKCLINTAGSFKVVIRYVAFSWGVQQFCFPTVSNYHQNMTHDINTLLLGGCTKPTLVSVLPQDLPAQASTSANFVLSPCCVVFYYGLRCFYLDLCSLDPEV
jgi:hypothetical protein